MTFDTHVSSNVADLAAARFMGGAAVLLAAAQTPSVRSVATVGAPCRPRA
ncbi:hypothetical protein RQM47_11020 [Rubrivirga sp. S365]|uniref:Uncharacterized protein n=1 Tax=Rubrivirga litoralis TaxID=3075598 RepID=A0ABU3BTN1_9BACT|nr:MULTISPECIES: hypothetical protein [unclassified Rubrivirga]MDT0632651.1 hypothetical protein [Rubrivirga sp. F394]MDT7857172.1 hypothetical protein [Rubrivirga sp. S365]